MNDDFEFNGKEMQNDMASENSDDIKYTSVESFAIEQKADESLAEQSFDGKKRKKPFPLWLKIVIPLVVCIIIAGLAVFITGLSNNDKYADVWQTAVPDTVNMSYKDAVKTLEEAGLQPLIEDKVSSSDVKEGCIVSQNIEKNTTVGKGNIVKLTISSGKEEMQMPDLKYYSSGYAFSVLENMGLTVKKETVNYTEDPAVSSDVVISSEPAPNVNISTGDTVTIQVYENEETPEPSELAVVPDLIDTDLATAMKTASDSGIYAIVTGVATGPADKKGFVISQNVASDVTVAKGAVIEVKICSGNENIIVPDVTYRKAEKAKALLSANNLDSRIQYEQSDKVLKGTVIRQEKEAGSTVQEKETVKIIVSLGKFVGVPELKGKTINSAVDKLVSSKLAVNVVFKVDKEVKVGNVISQNYNKGDRAQIGTVVTITVSGKKDSGEVPDTTPLSTELTSNESGYEIVSTTTVQTFTSETSSLPDVSIQTAEPYNPTKTTTTTTTKKTTTTTVTAEPSSTEQSHSEEPSTESTTTIKEY